MFGFGKKGADALKMETAALEVLIRQEGAFITLKRLIEDGLVSREDVVKVWKKADKDRRRHWSAKRPNANIMGSLIPEAIIDRDDDND